MVRDRSLELDGIDPLPEPAPAVIPPIELDEVDIALCFASLARAAMDLGAR